MRMRQREIRHERLRRRLGIADATDEEVFWGYVFLLGGEGFLNECWYVVPYAFFLIANSAALICFVALRLNVEVFCIMLFAIFAAMVAIAVGMIAWRKYELLLFTEELERRRMKKIRCQSVADPEESAPICSVSCPLEEK